MTNYEFYINEYNGAVISDEDTFNSIVIEATAYIDNFIVTETAKTLLKNKTVLKRYKYAVCAVCDVAYKQQNKNIVSESVGNHSVSYASKTESELQDEKRNKALLFLQGTGLLYRGLY